MESAVTRAIYRVLIKGMKENASPFSPEMVAAAASWAIYGAVKQWFYTPDHPPADEIVTPILQLVFPILMAGRSVESPSAAVGAHS
jgi:hypothetical protein